jgi:capsid protein
MRLSEQSGKPLARRPVGFNGQRVLRARFDNAETTDENYKYWANATDASADALGSADARRKLRARGRYECRNNSWAKGIRDTLANDCVGTGPRLQLLTDDKDLNTRVEMDFWAWREEVGLAEKLRTMRAARVDSGELFGLMATNPVLTHDVKLDITLVESEQVTDPFLPEPNQRMVDGIEYDSFGNPTRYWVMRHHPNDTGWWTSNLDDFDVWPAKFVLHYFRPDRPGQSRGIPDIAPGLDGFMELRRYSKATIAAGEAVADHALVIYSELEPTLTTDANGDPIDQTPEMLDTVELTRRMATTLPQGWKLGQVKAEQPITGYKEFVNAKLAEIARCLQVPFYIAALDSETTNMSAAYVVGQGYSRTVNVDRADLEQHLNRIFDVWLTEWLLVNDRRRSTDERTLPERFNRVWQWDEVGNHADPSKVANATQVNLAAGITNIPREAARHGFDWEDEQEAAAKSFGISVVEYRKLLVQKIFGAPKQANAPFSDTPIEDTSDEDETEKAGAE